MFILAAMAFLGSGSGGNWRRRSPVEQGKSVCPYVHLYIHTSVCPPPAPQMDGQTDLQTHVWMYRFPLFYRTLSPSVPSEAAAQLT